MCVLLLCKFWRVQCQKLCQKDTLVCMYLVSLDYPGWQIKSRHDTRRVAGPLNPKPKVDLKVTTGPTAMAEGSYGSFRPWRTILHSRWATCARPTSPVLVAKFIPHVHNLSQRSHRCIWQPLWWSRGSRDSGNLIGAEERTPGKKLDDQGFQCTLANKGKVTVFWKEGRKTPGNTGAASVFETGWRLIPCRLKFVVGPATISRPVSFFKRVAQDFRRCVLSMHFLEWSSLCIRRDCEVHKNE